MSTKMSEDGSNLLNLSEADTRAKLIDPAIHRSGWTEDHIRREETAGAVEPVSGRRKRGQIDYVLWPGQGQRMLLAHFNNSS